MAFLGLALMSAAACRSSAAPDDGTLGGPPSSGTPGLTPVVSASSLQLASSAAVWMNFAGRPVTISWNAIPGALSYDVEIGSAPGLSDVLSERTTNLSLIRAFNEPGTFYPRVTALTRSGAYASSGRLPLIIVSFQDYVEGLFLGTGPLAQAPQAGCLADAGVMTGWPSASNVLVTLTSSLTPGQKTRATTTVAQAAEAFAGAVAAGTRDVEAPHPTPAPLEIVAQQADVTLPFPCSASALGCTVPLQFSAPGLLARVSVVMNNGSLRIGHEIGHALYGFCHLSTVAGPLSVMGSFDDDGRGLGEADIEATRAVYRAGLRGGTRRGDFVAAGLVRP